MDTVDDPDSAARTVRPEAEPVECGTVAEAVGIELSASAVASLGAGPATSSRWREHEYPAIRALAKRAGATIFFGDEAGVRSDYHAGITWGVRGQTPVVPATGQRFGSPGIRSS